jgi:hypothetical protein
MKRFIRFLLSEMIHREFYLLLLCGFTLALMAVWRGALRDSVFNRIPPP